MKKSTRKLKAKETLEICEKGYYSTENEQEIIISEQLEKMVSTTLLVSTDDLDKLSKKEIAAKHTSTVIEITGEQSIEAIHRLAKEGNRLLCLNFASAKNPGGGFLNGALAQEESLAISSALYASQLKAFAFYETHRAMKSCMYSDTMIFSPDVPVFRNKKGELLDQPSSCSMITSAAVNAGVVKRKEPNRIDEISILMDKRIDKMFALAHHHKMDTLVLGAWGCGVFQNDPEQIAQLFNKHIHGKYKNAFHKIVFAIYSRNEKFIHAFTKEITVNS